MSDLTLDILMLRRVRDLHDLAARWYLYPLRGCLLRAADEIAEWARDVKTLERIVNDHVEAERSRIQRNTQQTKLDVMATCRIVSAQLDYIVATQSERRQ